jgi:hypothetical protein
MNPSLATISGFLAGGLTGIGSTEEHGQARRREQAMSASVASDGEARPIDLRNLAWCALAVAGMAGVIAWGSLWLLNFVHVMSGVLWTGIDLFMGFVVGPVMRSLPPPARRAMVLRLMPKMLFLLPTLAILTGTTGWFHARELGFLDMPWPAYGWVLAALVIVTALTVQGLGLLLPTNLLVYLELRKPAPDSARIARLMRRYVLAVGFQGTLQVAIIVVMARFVTGF